ncbi:CHAT domain-containing protein [Mycena capillaripes]|nr:CHAT domain-containing protein [Mycena capillaripes]
MCLSNLVNGLWTRFQQRGDTRDIDEALELRREVVTPCQPPHPRHDSALNNLAITLRERFQQQGDAKDLDEAIEIHRKALSFRGPSHPDRSMSLNNLGVAVLTRFEHQGDTRDIGEVIELHREALSLRKPPHADRGMSLNNLASAVQKRSRQEGDTRDINEAIELHREALTLFPLPHPGRGTSLTNLANAILTRFEQQGDEKDIEEAIELHRESLPLQAPPHPGHGMSLNNLANALARKFEQQGNMKDIEEAIELHRRALALRKPPHPDYGMFLNNLANSVWIRFEQHGDTRDLDEAIDLHREALTLHGPLHPIRSGSLNNLAGAVLARFDQQGNITDLYEAIELHRKALALREPPNLYRSTSLNNLGEALWRRFKMHRDTRDIDEAIGLHREALRLREPPHPYRDMSLSNLGNAIFARFDVGRDAADIDEAIKLHRAALDLRETPHPDRGSSLNNLANALCRRFQQQADTNDLEKAIDLHRQALNLRQPPHLHRGSSLHNLATCFVSMYVQAQDTDDLNSACQLFQEAVTYLVSSPSLRFDQALFWAKSVEKYSPTSSLTAYHTAIRLLPQVAALHLDLPSRQQILSTTVVSTHASDAATCAVALKRYNTALELQEASRSIFRSQALHLRTPLDDLAAVHPDLSAKLTDLAAQLEKASFRNAYRNTSTGNQHKIRSIESEGARCRQLNEDWEKTVKEVQQLPEFEDFMQPKVIGTLQHAAVSGQIVILTSTNSTCFALIVHLSREVQYLKLPSFTLPEAHVLADLSRGLSTPGFDFETFCETHNYGNDQSGLPARLSAGREGTIEVDQNDVFRGLLADLWKNIVKPKSADSPRLWWCPTGAFSFLPIRGAGIYGKDETDCVSDYVVSSYTPNLSALLNPPVRIATSFKMTAVIEPKAPHCSPLPGARKELKKVVERVPNEWVTPLVSTEVGTALVHLRESSIVHFACHGVQDLEQPLNSGLILTDGRLKVSAIMRTPERVNASGLKNSMSLAFLSACETAKGDKRVPDEAMHLAATLLFAGFRGVVATMWAMNDLDGPKIADTFYEHLFKNCDPNSDPPVLPDLTQAAKALHVALAKLREEPNTRFSAGPISCIMEFFVVVEYWVPSLLRLRTRRLIRINPQQ